MSQSTATPAPIDSGASQANGTTNVDEPLSSSVQEKFRGFSYSGSYDMDHPHFKQRLGASVDENSEDYDADTIKIDLPQRSANPELDLAALSLTGH